MSPGLNQIQFTRNAGVIFERKAAGFEVFGGAGIAWDDAFQLVWSGPEMFANDFAEDRAIIDGAFEIAAADTEHGAGVAGDPGHVLRVIGVAGAATEDAGGIAFLEIL